MTTLFDDMSLGNLELHAFPSIYEVISSCALLWTFTLTSKTYLYQLLVSDESSEPHLISSFISPQVPSSQSHCQCPPLSLTSM